MSAEIVDIRKYALVSIQGTTQLACYTNGSWTIDATCQSINEMLHAGLVCEDSIQGWIQKRVFRR